MTAAGCMSLISGDSADGGSGTSSFSLFFITFRKDVGVCIVDVKEGVNDEEEEESGSSFFCSIGFLRTCDR